MNIAGEGWRLAKTAEFEIKGRAALTAPDIPVTIELTFLSSSVRTLGIISDETDEDSSIIKEHRFYFISYPSLHIRQILTSDEQSKQFISIQKWIVKSKSIIKRVAV